MSDTNKFAIVIQNEDIRLETVTQQSFRPWDLAKRILGDSILQVVPIDMMEGRFAGLIDEDGKAKGLPKNKLATALCSPYLFYNDYIAGPMVICCNTEDLDGLKKTDVGHYDFITLLASVYCVEDQQYKREAERVFNYERSR